MNLTRSHVVAGVGYLIAGVVLYLLLVAADWGVGYYLEQLDVKTRQAYEKARTIEKEREEREDKELVADAKAKGLKSLFYPEMFSVIERWNNLAKEYSIAPLASLPNADIYYCNEGYGQVRYRSDRYGFRNPDTIWDRGRIDVAIIGDSFVHGACVGNDQTIAARMNQFGSTAINLATGGNSPVHYAAVVKTFTKVVRPKNLVIVFYANDNVANEEGDIYNEIFFTANIPYFEPGGTDPSAPPSLARNLVDLHEAISLEYDPGGGGASNRARPAPGAVTLRANIIAHQIPDEPRSNHFDLRNLRRLVGPLLRSKELPYGSRLALETAIKECETYQCRPIIAYIPNSEVWRPDARAESYARQLKIAAMNRGVTFIDLTKTVQSLGTRAYAVKGPHLSPEGYLAVTQEILEVIRRPH